MTGQPVGGVTVKAFPVARLLVPALMFIALVVAAVGSLGAPLITSVATSLHVSLGSAQWTLTIALLSGAVATPVLGRLGAGPAPAGHDLGHAGGRRRRQRLHHCGADRHRHHGDRDADKPRSRPSTLVEDHPDVLIPTLEVSMPKGYWISVYPTYRGP